MSATTTPAILRRQGDHYVVVMSRDQVEHRGLRDGQAVDVRAWPQQDDAFPARGRSPRLRKRETPAEQRLRPWRRRRRALLGVPITADDPLLDIIGIAHTDGPGDVSSNKYKYLADAYGTG